jgi:hypothetical protein
MPNTNPLDIGYSAMHPLSTPCMLNGKVLKE